MFVYNVQDLSNGLGIKWSCAEQAANSPESSISLIIINNCYFMASKPSSQIISLQINYEEYEMESRLFLVDYKVKVGRNGIKRKM